ncbi:MAG: AI-2E family transporter [Chloroflexi bacterium]|nr:AI-2E family transporter [Chloroflexota bacterium]
MSKSWSKTTRYLVLILVLAAILWFFLSAKDLIETLAISALLAYILNPVVTFVNKRARVGRNWIVLLVYLLSLAALVTLGIIFIPVIPEQTASLVSELQIILEQVEQDYLSTPLTFLTYEIPLNTLIPEIPELSPDAFIQPDIILTAVQATTTNVGWLMVILVSTFYLLQDWGRLREWMFGWAPEGYDMDVRMLYRKIREVWNQYFRGQLRLSLTIGILSGIGSAAVGLPGAVIFGILAGVFDVLLSVGPVMITAVAALVALFAGSTFLPVSNVLFMLIILVIFGVIQILENVWLRPSIMGHTLNIHPAVVFIAIIASLALAGVLTALIIIPVLASVGVIGRYLHAKIFDIDPWRDIQPSSSLNGNRDATSPTNAIAPQASEKEG